MKKLSDVFYVVVIISVVCFGGCSKKQAETQQVVLYCSADQEYAEPIIAAFERQTGIKVLARFDTEAGKTVGLVQRLRSEGKSPIADVFWSSEVFYTIRLAREGLLDSYSSIAQKNWPGFLVGQNKLWHGFALRARVIAYSTSRVKSADVPRSLEDLCDPKWKGRIVIANPAFGTTGGDVASWFVHYGQARAKEILAQLRANNIRIVDGNSTAVRLVATGQADVCMTDTDDVYAAQRNGWPVAMAWLDQGGAGTLAIPNTVALVAGSPHREPAMKLINFLLSEQVEKMLAQSDSHNSPVHPSLKKEFNKYDIPKPIDISYEKIADTLPEAIKVSRKILRR